MARGSYSLSLLFLALGLASAFHTGAPGDQACDSMTPGHGFPAQTGNSPYRIMLASTKSSGEPILITLVAPSQGPKLKGFFIQVRPVGGSQPVGQFDPNSDSQAQPVTCGGKENAGMTHKDNNEKEQIKLKWTPPQGNGQYDVFVTFVKQQDTFWVKQTPDGQKITVSTAAADTAGRAGPGSGTSGQPQPNSQTPSSSGNSSSPPQPPSEAGASSNIPMWSAISISFATVMISFFRYTTHFRVL